MISFRVTNLIFDSMISQDIPGSICIDCIHFALGVISLIYKLSVNYQNIKTSAVIANHGKADVLAGGLPYVGHFHIKG